MGGDARLMTPLKVSGLDLLPPDHLEAQPRESLPDYASRVAHTHSLAPDDFVGGASFGGMVAAEIARQQKVAGLILLGSCIRPQRLPSSYRWFERLGRLTPDVVLALRSWGPLVRWRFAPITPEAQRILVEMARACPPKQLRDFGRMVLGWGGLDSVPCPLLSIHGDRDRIIPVSCAEPGLVLKNAGHAFTLTHVSQTQAAIQEFVQRVSPR